VNFFWALSFAAAGWWSCSTAILLLSALAALVHPVRRQKTELRKDFPPLSVIVPVKDLHAGFAEAQRSLFSPDCPPLEILIAAHNGEAPALSAIREMQIDDAAPRIVISDCTAAASPKLNNLWPAICQSENDLVLTKDSNVVLHSGDIAAFLEAMDPHVGLVSAIPIATQPLSFPAWIEASIINGYHARVLMLGDAIGLGFGLGKIMLFRRSDLMRAGGFDCLKWAVGEDMALARAMQQLGLRTVLAGRVCHQTLGHRSLRDVWQRQLRWMTIWRVQLPAAFVVDLLGSALPTGLAGAVAAPLIGSSPAAMFAGTFAGWFAIEFLVSAARGWPISLWSPVAFLARELLTPMLWFCALVTREVRWAGATYRVHGRKTPAPSHHSADSAAYARGRMK
jgi:ceramide glucosyltransferase